MNISVLAADTVNTAEALDDTHWIPMYIIIHKKITILQILTFGNTISSNQNIYLVFILRENQLLILRQGCKTGQYSIQITPKLRYRASAIHRACNHSRMQAKLLLHMLADMLIKISSSIGKGSKHNTFLVICIQGMLNFIVYKL